LIDETRLRQRLREAAAQHPGLTLLVQADVAAQYRYIMRLTLLAREAGITESVLATLPRPLAALP
jgi:biopolymer transport protein ExbD